MKNAGLYLVFMLFSSLYMQSQTTDSLYYKFKTHATIGFDLILHNGIWGGSVPAIPIENTVNISGTPYYGTAFGININYHFLENLSLYFDINKYTRKTPVAYQNSHASSDWIFEKTDYNSREVGPFDEDVFYNVNTTGFRLGLKAYLQHKKTLQPWFGFYWGYYSVYHGIYNKDNTKTYGNGYDYVSGLSYINIGVDIFNKSKNAGISLFYEMGAPVYRNYDIENCLVTGWTFHDSGEGEHIFGYNRIGISLIFNTSKKNKTGK